jgi:tRNA-Thr(GGU) m(6)t(6)A37 methyltransferase TsaA
MMKRPKPRDGLRVLASTVRPLVAFPPRRTEGFDTMEDVSYTPIGVIHTPFPDSKGMPRGPDAGNQRGTVEVFPAYYRGLLGLEGFSRILLVFHMHRSEGPMLEVLPLNEERPRGVFSTRSPRRPNPIGITAVKLERIDGNVLHVSGVDMVDGTPLLDIKPFLQGDESVERRGARGQGTPANRSD